MRALYADDLLVLRTGQGPASVEALLRDLEGVRACGYAFDNEMVTLGISCLAAPVISHDGTATAAIGVTFVAAQRASRDVEAAAELVLEVSSRMSAHLGYTPPSIGPHVA